MLNQSPKKILFFLLFFATSSIFFFLGRVSHSLASDVAEAEKIAFPIVRALEIHKIKMGKYPSKISELRNTSPDLDDEIIELFPDGVLVDEKNSCITIQSYCLLPSGSYILGFGGHLSGVCFLKSDEDFKFTCQEGI